LTARRAGADEFPVVCRSLPRTDAYAVDTGGIVKFPLCSSGISNPSIHDALVVSEGHWKLFTASESR
jgi:hypothetical protein